MVKKPKKKTRNQKNLFDLGNRLHAHEFGKQLIDTGDLDPVYILCDRYYWEDDYVRNRWLLGYWCFYHVGTACWLASATSEKQYWFRMMKAAKSKDYPRSPERRHFRAANAINSVDYLKTQGMDRLFRRFLPTTLPATQIIDYVKEWEGFGPWIAFKVADMLQALNITDVQFTHDVVTIYKQPMEGAKLFVKTYGSQDVGVSSTSNGAIWQSAYKTLHRDIGRKTLAPPQYLRPIGIPEIETVFCKWKSHMNGKYHVGEDIISMRKALTKYEDNSMCQEMLEVVDNTPQFKSILESTHA